jgi:beta-lactamase class A
MSRSRISLLALLTVLVAGCAGASRPAAAPVATALTTAAAERHDALLQATLDSLVAEFGGEAGVYVRHLASGRSASVRADELFPTASMVKVMILVGLFDAADRGRVALHEPLTYHPWLQRSDGDVVASFRYGERITPQKLAFLMLSLSDNAASVWLQAVVNTHEINRWMEANGFEHSRVNSRTPGREAAFRQWGWGQTTPREIAELMVRIREGRAVSAAASERMYRLLVGSYWHDDGLASLPPHVQVASKGGWLSQSRSEVMLVSSPGGDYALAVITRNQQDRGSACDNPGNVLIRRVSEAAYRHFNPGDDWRPAEGLERFRAGGK